MDLGTLVPIAAPVATVIAAAVAAQPLLRQYELKAKEERRLAETSRVEADVRLVEAFTTLMGKAHARGPTVVLEQALIKLIEQRASVSPEEFEALADACVVVSPVGAAEQDAAIAAIAELGIEHPVLRYPAGTGTRRNQDVQGSTGRACARPPRDGPDAPAISVEVASLRVTAVQAGGLWSG